MCLRKEGYKDFGRFQQTRNEQRKRYYNQTSWAINAKLPWTQSEIDRVMQHDIPDMKLANEIGRSVASIQHMRWKMIHVAEKEFIHE